MPKIPVLTDRQVEPGPLNAPAVRLNLPQDNTGQGLQRLSDALQKVQERRDRIAVENAYGAAYDDARELLYGPKGLFSKKGSQVPLNATQDLGKLLDELALKHSGELSHVQKLAFDEQMHNFKSSTLNKAASYESAQHTAADIQALQSQATRNAQMALANPTAPIADTQRLIAEGAAKLAEAQRRSGDDPDTIKLGQEAFTSGVWAGDITALAEINPSAANDQFEALVKKGVFTPEDKAKITSHLKSVTLESMGRSKTLALWEKYKDDKKGGMAAVDKINDAALADNVRPRMKARYADAKNQKADDYNKLHEDVSHQVVELLQSGTGKASEAIDIIRHASGLTTEDELKLENLANTWYGVKKLTVSVPGATRNAQIEIDNEDITSEYDLMLAYGDSLTTKDYGKVKQYLLDGGNVSGLRRTKIDSLFEDFTTKKAAERPDASQKFWQYMIDNLPSGAKITDALLGEMAFKLFMRPGMIDNAIFRDTDTTYGAAVKAGKGSKYLPYTKEQRDAAVAKMNAYNATSKTDRRFDPDDPKQVEAVVLMGGL